MTSSIKILAAAAALALGGIAGTSEARVIAIDAMGAEAQASTEAAAPAAKIEIARRGRCADDGAGHDANDDRGRRGRDGGRGRGRGTDDGPNHT